MNLISRNYFEFEGKQLCFPDYLRYLANLKEIEIDRKLYDDYAKLLENQENAKRLGQDYKLTKDDLTAFFTYPVIDSYNSFLRSNLSAIKKNCTITGGCTFDSFDTYLYEMNYLTDEQYYKKLLSEVGKDPYFIDFIDDTIIQVKCNINGYHYDPHEMDIYETVEKTFGNKIITYVIPSIEKEEMFRYSTEELREMGFEV